MSDTDYLGLDDLLQIAQAACGTTEVQVRDYGLLVAALARPRASMFGQDAYPDLHVKTASLLHSLVRNHALVDGNRRLAWAATFVFLDLNGHRIAGAREDERVAFVVAVASGQLDSLEKIAEQLRAWRN